MYYLITCNQISIYYSFDYKNIRILGILHAIIIFNNYYYIYIYLLYLPTIC